MRQHDTGELVWGQMCDTAAVAEPALAADARHGEATELAFIFLLIRAVVVALLGPALRGMRARSSGAHGPVARGGKVQKIGSNPAPGARGAEKQPGCSVAQA